MKKNSSGYYEKKIDIGRDPETGKRIRKAIRAKSIAELDRKVFQFKQDQKIRSSDPGADINFETYAKRWMTTKQSRSINTRNMYANLIDRYILPSIGELYFHEISLELLQRIINENYQHFNLCTKLRLTMKQIYEMAEDEGIALRHINFKRLAMPVKKMTTEKRPLTPEEEDAIFEADIPDMEKAFVYTLYYTGMRREEALALLPSDFDFVNMRVSVNKTVVFDDNDPVLNEGMAKTKYSIRKIPLPDAAASFLKEYCSSCEGFMFQQTRKGGLMSKTSYNKFWRRIRAVLVPLAPSADTLTAYTFRHNYATMLYYSDIKPKMAAKLMGHKDTTMILRIYAHLDEEREMADVKLNKVFSK